MLSSSSVVCGQTGNSCVEIIKLVIVHKAVSCGVYLPDMTRAVDCIYIQNNLIFAKCQKSQKIHGTSRKNLAFDLILLLLLLLLIIHCKVKLSTVRQHTAQWNVLFLSISLCYAVFGSCPSAQG